MNPLDYLNVLSDKAPFVIMAVMGLAWLYGKLGLSGRKQLLAAFLTGFVVGGMFQIAIAMPQHPSAADWFWTFITSVLMGLMPSGFYEAVKAASKKGFIG